MGETGKELTDKQIDTQDGEEVVLGEKGLESAYSLPGQFCVPL